MAKLVTQTCFSLFDTTKNIQLLYDIANLPEIQKKARILLNNLIFIFIFFLKVVILNLP